MIDSRNLEPESINYLVSFFCDIADVPHSENNTAVRTYHIFYSFKVYMKSEEP